MNYFSKYLNSYRIFSSCVFLLVFAFTTFISDANAQNEAKIDNRGSKFCTSIALSINQEGLMGFDGFAINLPPEEAKAYLEKHFIIAALGSMIDEDPLEALEIISNAEWSDGEYETHKFTSTTQSMSSIFYVSDKTKRKMVVYLDEAEQKEIPGLTPVCIAGFKLD